MNDQRIRGDTLSSFLSLSLSECLRPSLAAPVPVPEPEPTKWAAANNSSDNKQRTTTAVYPFFTYIAIDSLNS